MRGERGLWISAYARSAEAPAGEQIAATALLKQAAQLGQTFSEAAATHRTVKLAAHEGAAQAKQSSLIGDQPPLQALLTSARTTVSGQALDEAQAQARERNAEAGAGKVPHSGDPLLGLAAPAGIGLVAGQSLQWAVGETLTLASGQASNAAIAKDLRLHAGQAIGWLANAVQQGASSHDASNASASTATALSLVAAQGQLEFEAQHDIAKLQSRDPLKIVSANAQVELAAGKTVHLATAGGASVTIEGGNITIACPGTITVHAGKKSFVGPTQQNYPLPAFPESVCVECLLQAMSKGQALSPKNG